MSQSKDKKDKRPIPDNLEGVMTEDLKKMVFEGLLGNFHNPYEGLGELDPPEVRAARERARPKLYIILKHNNHHAGAWLMYAADEESIYRYIFYEFFENFITCSGFFENIRLKQTPKEIAERSDPSTFSFFDIKEMIDRSEYIVGKPKVYAFRISELTMTTLPTVKRLREKLPDPADLIPPTYDDDDLDMDDVDNIGKVKEKKEPPKKEPPKKEVPKKEPPKKEPAKKTVKKEPSKKTTKKTDKNGVKVVKAKPKSSGSKLRELKKMINKKGKSKRSREKK